MMGLPGGPCPVLHFQSVILAVTPGVSVALLWGNLREPSLSSGPRVFVLRLLILGTFFTCLPVLTVLPVTECGHET